MCLTQAMIVLLAAYKIMLNANPVCFSVWALRLHVHA